MRKLFGKFHRSHSDRATFARFATVGTSISAVDAGGLYLLMLLGINVYLGRVFSYTAAMTVGYILNRYFTFHHLETGRALWHSLLRHFSVHSIGGLLNFGVFSLILLLAQGAGSRVDAAALLPLFAVWAGGIVGLCCNFFLSKHLVFDN